MAQQFLDSNVVKSNPQNVAAFNAWLAAHDAAYDHESPDLFDPAEAALVEAEVNTWNAWLALTEAAGIASPGHQLGLLHD